MDCHTRDMTATFSADVTLKVAQAKLAEFNQWLPIDGDENTSLGRLVETNSTGPLRLGYGAWRDLMLGAQFHNGAGELITAGGRTVKNVAGYDFTKFMVGQRGVFGKLVTITTRTWRRPAAALLARFAPSDRTLGELMPTPARPHWAVLNANALLCGYLGDDKAIEFYQSILPKHGPQELTRRETPEDMADRARLWKMPAGRIARASVPPTRILEYVKMAGLSDWVADAGFGIVLSPAAGESRLRSTVNEAGGSIFFHDADGGSFDIPANPIERKMIETIKNAFDPNGTLATITWQT
jgi:hypothetical protein